MSDARPVPPCPQLVEVVHPNLPGVSKATLKEKIATMYKVRRSPRRRRAPILLSHCDASA